MRASAQIGITVSGIVELTRQIGQIPQVLYWGRVGSELAKIVFRNQKMTPP